MREVFSFISPWLAYVLGFGGGFIVGCATMWRLRGVTQLIDQNVELRESLRGVLELLPFVSGPLCTRARAALGSDNAG